MTTTEDRSQPGEESVKQAVGETVPAAEFTAEFDQVNSALDQHNEQLDHLEKRVDNVLNFINNLLMGAGVVESEEEEDGDGDGEAQEAPGSNDSVQALPSPETSQ